MRRPVLTALAGGALAGALALTGCTSSPVGARATSSPAPTGSAAADPAVAAARPSRSAPPPTQDPVAATAVRIPCATLVPTTVLKAFRVGYRPVRVPTLPAGTDGARVRRLGGTVCQWRDASTRHIVRVAVAEPSPKDLLALKNDLVDRSQSVPTYRVEGYFRPTTAGGISDAFPGRYWVHASSQDFYEPGDAITLVQAAQQALAAH
jgi:hypothetical protein